MLGPTVHGLGPGLLAGTMEKLLFVAVHIGTHAMAHARETLLQAARENVVRP